MEWFQKRLNLDVVMHALIAIGVSACSQLVPQKPAASSSVTLTYQASMVSGNSQTGTAGNNLSYAFVALITDSTGKPAESQSVTWNVTSGGGSLTGAYSTTTQSGLVSAILTLGATVGTNTVTATLKGNTSSVVSFTANGVAGPISALHSTIVGSGPVENDGINTSAITITLKDANNNSIMGVVPTFAATGSNNNYGTCSASNASGVSNCTLSSTTAETKVLSIASPVVIGGTVVFAPGAVVSANSSITASGPVVANGVSTSTVTITLKDADEVGVGGIVPTFSATNTGATNTYGTCSSSNASGISTCTLSSTVAETKTISLTSPVSVTGGTVSFIAGAVSGATSTITGTGPVEPDGTSSSLISVSLLDAFHNPISGIIPTFTATNTGSTNQYGACSSTGTNGQGTCTLKSQTAETKTLSLLTPINFSGGTVVFAPTTVVAANSSITGTGPVVANGIATSTITITLEDINHVPVGGIVPSFTATNTSNGNTYGVCSSSNATTGVSTCTFTSTVAETKTLSLASPVTLTGGTVVFEAGPVSQATSSITAVGPVVADGSSTATVSIQILDANSNPLVGVTPTFAATDTGSTNHYGSCSSSDTSGRSSCTLSSTKAESKQLSIVSPGSVTGGSVVFIAGSASISTSSITGAGPVEPDGVSTSLVTITLNDQFDNPISGTVPTFSATDTGGRNGYGSCSSSSISGVSTCHLASSTAETKTLSLLTPVAMSGGSVVFAPGAASSTYSSISGTGPVLADGVSTSTVTITLKDSNDVAIVGSIPTFSATNSGNVNTYGTCSPTNSSGISTCSLSSTRAEVKTLYVTSPLGLSGNTVTFTSGTVSASTSQITGTGPITADGASSSSITIVLYDAFNNPIAGTIPTFGATDTGSTNIYGTCSTTSVSGASTCTLKSTKAEIKALAITSPVSHSGGTVSFTSQAASSANSTITGTSPVVADGSASSTVTITLLDVNNNSVSGVVPTFSATNTGNTNNYGTCSSTNVSGVSTCALKSTHEENKTLTLLTPVSVTGGTVVFGAGSASAATSTITGAGPVNADGVSTSTITITLLDANSNPVSGTVPTFSATNTGATNVYGSCSSSNASGISTCTLKSTYGETKTLTLSTPASVAGGTVVFNQEISSAYTTITGTGPVNADGVSTSTITITLNDYSSRPISGVVPTFNATDTGSTNVYGTCSSTNGSGVSTCTLQSTQAETKTLSIMAPVAVTGGMVVFN